MKYLLAAVIFTVCVIFPDKASEGVKNGLELCCTMVIPSLYPLMFASLLMMRTGFAQILSKPLSFAVNRLFRLPAAAGFALFAAMCGGYPAGAAAVKELYSNGTLDLKQAERLSYFAVSAGPAFVIGAVGGAIYKNPMVGGLLFAVLCLSVIITGVIVSCFSREDYCQMRKNEMSLHNYGAGAFADSAVDSAKTLLSVCVFVILFACLRNLLCAAGVEYLLGSILGIFGISENCSDAVISALLEVSGGCVEASEIGFPAVAFALGFGGLSVHFQIFSVLGDIQINKLKFIFFRLLQGGICAAITAALMPLMPETAIETGAFDARLNSMPTASGSVCLVIMCLMAVVCTPRPLTKGEKRV